MSLAFDWRCVPGTHDMHPQMFFILTLYSLIMQFGYKISRRS
jgi:hypothetical protein